MMREDMPQGEFEQLRKKLIHDTQLAAISQISRRIAHDLRNPLAVVRNAVYLLKRKVPQHETKWHEYFAIIEQATATADGILAELTAFSRGKPPNRGPVDLRVVLTAARRTVIALDTIQWHFAMTPDPLVMNIDAAQWEQVFHSLFLNSLEAMGKEGRITVEAKRLEHESEILVADSGPGIPPDIRALIFDPLFGTKSRVAGLGLTVARQIVQQHGGTIELAESTQGAAFLVRLPHSVD